MSTQVNLFRLFGNKKKDNDGAEVKNILNLLLIEVDKLVTKQNKQEKSRKRLLVNNCKKVKKLTEAKFYFCKYIQQRWFISRTSSILENVRYVNVHVREKIIKYVHALPKKMICQSLPPLLF